MHKITIKLTWDGKIPPALQLKYGTEKCIVDPVSKTVSVVIDDGELSDAMEFLSSGGVEMAGPMQHIPSISGLHELTVKVEDVVHTEKTLTCEDKYVWLQRQQQASVIVGGSITVDLARLTQLGVPFSLALCKVACEEA